MLNNGLFCYIYHIMKKKKVLITGGSGFLGQYLNIELSKEFDILTLFNRNPGNCTDYNSAIADLKNTKVLYSIFTRFKPEIVIHTACYSNPELCNKFPKDEVLSLNVNVTKEIADLCKEYNSKLIFTSTDLVYKSSDELKDENSELEPKSLYAETKILAEEIIRESCVDYLILRTALLYGIGLNRSKTHFESMIQSLDENKSVNLFYNQYRTPLEVSEAANIICELIKKDIRNETINFGGKEKISRYEIGKITCEVFGFNKKNLIKKNGEEIIGDLFVKDVSMNTEKFQSMGILLNGIKENIEEIKKGLIISHQPQNND